LKVSNTIEGFGLPGSGKSTTISNLKNHDFLPEFITVLLRKNGDTKFLDVAFQYSNYKLRTLIQLFVCFYYLALRPVLFFYVVQSLIIFKFNRNYFSVLRTLIEALYCSSRAKKKAGYLLLDEGLVQYLGTLVVNVPESHKLPKYILQHVIKNYIYALIYFDINSETAINRIKQRNDGKSRFDFMEDKNAIVNLSRMREVFHICIEIGQKLNRPILRIKGEKTINENTETILKFLEKEIK
jgi:thymidylate kinase